MDKGIFGNINMDRLYATGISSGGYHTSRMAVSFPGIFRALAVESASYATCGGPLCALPKLAKNHPPTLFLHGEKDLVVPVETMLPYYQELKNSGVDTQAVIDANARHQWLDEAPERITHWFLNH
ncbi:Poly(3-hydroxyoctanoate) depolymerase precursor [compost metagenome]